MKDKQKLDAIDQSILDIISLYESLEFLELWYEIGEDDVLKKQLTTREELSRRLEFLVSKGHVEPIMDAEESTLWALKK